MINTLIININRDYYDFVYMELYILTFWHLFMIWFLYIEIYILPFKEKMIQ